MVSTWQSRLRRAALVGGLAWAAASALGLFVERGPQLVALAPVTIVPLALSLGAPGSAGTSGAAGIAGIAGAAEALYRAAAGLVLLSGPLALLSLLLLPSPGAAALCAPWLAATLMVALVGAQRLYRRRVWPLHEAAIDAGFLYLPVGAVWLLASRLGHGLLGFQEPIVTFTAAHFHYAGLAAPVVAGALGRSLGDRAGSALYRGATAIVLLGIPMVAAGIQLSRAVELPSAVALALGMLGCAVLLVRSGLGALLSAGSAGKLAGLLRALGGVSLVFSMLLAVLFAATGSATRGASAPMIAYSDMADLHGAANALGFSLLSLVSFALEARAAEAPEQEARG